MSVSFASGFLWMAAVLLVMGVVVASGKESVVSVADTAEGVSMSTREDGRQILRQDIYTGAGWEIIVYFALPDDNKSSSGTVGAGLPS